mmetsp:Transcript_22837/g.64638  ORF Transcript_22837/g.64638 Transcript_22837/m.64638 type:complete len:610 (+) Transcript_22837:106-1935(+)|eukprot:CAMPEP_0119567876 /NCGR_PEP_ID=MMETSP1352-20130426/37252_1 /TAXON_ID=265584 /ORGANISM="Stauroneis constricta, Strain CCMP1120" /LENGTH=609 /DNA_ID=CAMNT_0007617189 /DNA_START=54 /DNA_END=1883 /DNA_ORIENTATION=+
MCTHEQNDKARPNKPAAPASEPSPPAAAKGNGDEDVGRSNGGNTDDDRTAMAKAKATIMTKRRGKRDRDGTYIIGHAPAGTVVTKNDTNNNAKGATTSKKKGATTSKKKSKRKSKALQRHGKDNPSGGVEALLPSFIGVAILVCAVLAQQGFRGRATVAGIDLGTTNSVICVQQQTKGVGTIDCIPDPDSGSPIIPSVVSVLELAERPVGTSSKVPSVLNPHPSAVVVGQSAKDRIESHPHHTVYHAKRVLGRDHKDPAVDDLKNEVEYAIITQPPKHDEEQGSAEIMAAPQEVAFQVDDVAIAPENVGSYVVDHLIKITNKFLGHDNVKSAVLAVPAKFNALQRQRTMEAFKNAGITVARVLEEPTAAALAYGLHKKDGVEKILVYDFGGGTLDISILHVSDGFCDVMGSDGDDRLGGANFDASVAALLSSRHSNILQSLDQTGVDAEELAASCSRITPAVPLCSRSSFHTIGERLKIALSSSSSSDGDEAATAQCYGLTKEVGHNDESATTMASICQQLTAIPIELTLEDYDRACQPLYDRAILPADRLMKDLTLTTDEIDEIVMVGGTTRMPQIRKLVREAFDNAELNTHIDPDVTVAYGAASVID